MIQSATMFTYELDNPALALEEIKSQIAKKITLMKNSVGIVMCDPEFIDSGVLRTVCEGLPFSVAGTTTMTQAVNGEAGILMLTLMILTSDDVFFEAGMTDPIQGGGDILSSTKTAYEKAADALNSKPKLILAFPPLILENAGDQYIDVFETLCPDTPVFGTLAIDDSITFEKCSTLYNGRSSLSAMSFILISGNVSPKFSIATMSDKNELPYTGEITKSKAHVVYEINDMKTSEYFENIGFAKNGKLDQGLQFVPFLLDFKKRSDYDGIPVVRAMVHLDENGAGICRGYMYQNSVFILTNPSSEDIFEASEKLVDKLNEEKPQAIIIFSCMVRRMIFGSEPLTEVNMLLKKMNPDIPFMMAYSGGEICPTSYRADSVTNRFHNYSMIACIL